MAELLEDFNGSKKYDFPDDETFELMKTVLRTERGKKVENVSTYNKHRIMQRFALISSDGEEYVIGKSTKKRVIKRSQTAQILASYHDETGHPGRDTVLGVIKQNYHYFPKSLVVKHIEACDNCAKARPLPNPPCGKPIRSKGPMERLQADLINVQNLPGDDIKYVLQVKDHCSKFIWLFGLERRTCKAVVQCLRKLFRYWGPCRVLQTDNGGEFTGQEMRALREEFKCIKKIEGRARHPQSQGLVERANQTLEKRIGAWIRQNGADGWGECLDQLAFEINRSTSRPIKTTPFQMMYSRLARDPFSADIDDSDDEDTVEDLVEDEREVEAELNESADASLCQITSDQNETQSRPMSTTSAHADASLGQTTSDQSDTQSGLMSTPSAHADASLCQITTNQVDSQSKCRDSAPYLPFQRGPVAAIAIGELVERESLHNHPVLKSEACFKIVEVVTDTPPSTGPFDEPITAGSFIKWPKPLVTNKLGDSAESLKLRIAPFISYEQDREKQAHKYDSNRKRQVLEVGDFGAMKIARYDRAGIDATNLPVKVLSVNNEYLTLQTPSGILENKVHVDQVLPLPNKVPPPQLLISPTSTPMPPKSPSSAPAATLPCTAQTGMFRSAIASPDAVPTPASARIAVWSAAASATVANHAKIS